MQITILAKRLARKRKTRVKSGSVGTWLGAEFFLDSAAVLGSTNSLVQRGDGGVPAHFSLWHVRHHMPDRKGKAESGTKSPLWIPGCHPFMPGEEVRYRGPPYMFLLRYTRQGGESGTREEQDPV